MKDSHETYDWKDTLKLIAALLIAAVSCLPLRAAESIDMRKRTTEFQNLRWGMFICWSFSTFSGQEWTNGVKDVAFFKATECDTDQWARTAKEAGMGYILFLTKHHDGVHFNQMGLAKHAERWFDALSKAFKWKFNQTNTGNQ